MFHTQIFWASHTLRRLTLQMKSKRNEAVLLSLHPPSGRGGSGTLSGSGNEGEHAKKA